MSYQSINPATGETSQTFGETTDHALELALQTAAACFESWRDLTFAARAAIANNAAEILRSRVDEFARLVTLEMGKRFEEAQAEVQLSADIIAYYAGHAEEFLAPEMLHPESGAAHIESSPLGVLFGVQPWNFPYYQLARFAAPNLMAGNVVMVKHSGTVPQCALAFEKLWREAGAPAAPTQTCLFPTIR
jgi:succinate-semialdehyde dehydrogenase / glutarate-semialdehyde dehydrogenase